jgi:hypothetical protein
MVEIETKFKKVKLTMIHLDDVYNKFHSLQYEIRVSLFPLPIKGEIFLKISKQMPLPRKSKPRQIRKTKASSVRHNSRNDSLINLLGVKVR